MTELVNGNPPTRYLRDLESDAKTIMVLNVRNIENGLPTVLKKPLSTAWCDLIKAVACDHLFGDMYEQLLRDLQAAGNAGEFYTPRAVTEFMVRMTNPRLGEKVMDPACGTGGFLSCSIEHIRRQDVKTVDDEAALQASIFGIEKKPMPHLLCTTNMILHGIDVPSNIRHDNTLARPLISWTPKERVDVVVTNPPFGGMEEDGIETNFPAAFRSFGWRGDRSKDFVWWFSWSVTAILD